MTGFGRTEFNFDDKNYVIEIRSLNGKNLDINLKSPSYIKSLENDIRKLIGQMLFRGTIDCQVHISSNSGVRPVSINTELARSYYNNISSLTQELGIEQQNILQVLMAMPEVVYAATTELSDDEKEAVLGHVREACTALQAFRDTEGAALSSELNARVQNIVGKIPDIEQFEARRVIKIRERMIRQLNDISEDVNHDNNRLEQEMIYYLEKLDISEEKQRLHEHCRLFSDTLEQDNRQGVGKKLNFILQEIGREINTLGSKANDADIQKIVIEMKDELEKAKEQSLNVL